MNKNRFNKLLSDNLPWGPLFANRSHFQYGYLSDEGYFVAKYLIKPSNVLVIGAGNGREARPICGQGHKIVCFDIGSIYCESGQRLFKNEGIKNVYFLEADMFDLPFARNSFDFVFFSLYSYAGELRFEMLKNIRFILRPSGLILLSCCTPLYGQLNKRKLNKELVFISSEREINNEVSSCGFDLLESRVDSGRPEYRFSMIRMKQL